MSDYPFDPDEVATLDVTPERAQALESTLLALMRENLLGRFEGRTIPREIQSFDLSGTFPDTELVVGYTTTADESASVARWSIWAGNGLVYDSPNGYLAEFVANWNEGIVNPA